jgi:dimethyladenosine transferase 1
LGTCTERIQHYFPDKIIKFAKVSRSDCICEVGPGPGSLTRSILKASDGVVFAIEKDRRFLPSLQLLSDATDGRLKVCHDDVLSFDWSRSCDDHVISRNWDDDISGLDIVGNLPFNVSIPLLLQWLESISSRKGPFKYGRSSMTLTFQREVAERIVAPPCDPQRSRLSIMVQHLCNVKWGFILHSSNFVPRPKVEAVILRITPLVKPIIDVEYQVLEKIVKGLFQYRRKYIKHGAKLLFPDEPDLADKMLDISGVDRTLRPQQLTLQDYQSLCNAYTTITNTNNRIINQL